MAFHRQAFLSRRQGCGTSAHWAAEGRGHRLFLQREREQEAEIAVQNGRRAAKLNGVGKKIPCRAHRRLFAPYCSARSICAW